MLSASCMDSRTKHLKILLSPFGKKLIEGGENAKTYPYAEALVGLLKQEGHYIVQVGTRDEKQICDSFLANLPYKELCKVIQTYDTFIGVDSYLQHLAWFLNKPGIVLWGISDPNIFGHSIHHNLFRDRKYFRFNQFDSWEKVQPVPDSFIKPSEVLDCLHKYFAD